MSSHLQAGNYFPFHEIAETVTHVAPPVAGARLPQLLDSGFGDVVALHARLAALDITIVGTGSIGMRAACECARLGVHTLRLVDPGHLKAESALTYPVTLDDTGKSKVEYAGARCKCISPSTRVLVYEGRVEDLDTVAFLDTQMIVLAPDLLAPEVVAGRHARLLGIPLVRAAVHGDTIVAQIRSYAGGAEGPCPACFFGDEEWDGVYRQTRFSCDGTQVVGESGPSGIPVTRSFGALCSLAADLTVVEVLRRLLPVGKERLDVLVEYRGYTHEIHETPLARNATCPGEHRALDRVPVASLAEIPLETLLGQAGAEAGTLAGITVTVDRRRFVEQTRCTCTPDRVHGRFAAAGDGFGACAACGAERAADPFTTHHEVPGEVLVPHLSRTLGALGASDARSVTVRGDAVRTLLHSTT